jgi:hypothetical protein
MILAISRRTELSRSTASWSVASDPTGFIVEQAEGENAGGSRKAEEALGRIISQAFGKTGGAGRHFTAKPGVV